MKVTCTECRHPAELLAPSDVWKCNCAAGVGPTGCACDATNRAEHPVEDNPPDRSGEIAALEQRLLELRGDTAPEGERR